MASRPVTSSRPGTWKSTPMPSLPAASAASCTVTSWGALFLSSAATERSSSTAPPTG
ncbi:Uncharacterised protein [Mycobacteroides abscessus subsp. abscessus]|nr:Uncharacterised protein [Mycobacteroides abscessus subsp. abscessus]